MSTTIERKRYTDEELVEILAAHKLWVLGKDGGVCADLTDANLTRADLSRAYLRGAVLRGAVLRGADLTDANLTDANLTDANLRVADLTGANLSGANLSGADLIDANLTDANLTDANLRVADLTGANLRRADLRRANLSETDLSETDLSGADLTGALEIPIVEQIDKRILAVVEAGEGILEMRNWHGDDGRCGTTHCRAGWAIHFAGDVGYALEDAIGPSAAGALIYARSCPTLKVPDFNAYDEDALADIRARAGNGC